MIEFVCRRCGRCCEGDGTVRLLPGEEERLAAFLGVEVREFADRYTRLAADRQGLCLADRPDGACVFLDEDGQCRVQPVKPEQCRRFPLGWRNADTEAVCPVVLSVGAA